MFRCLPILLALVGLFSSAAVARGQAYRFQRYYATSVSDGLPNEVSSVVQTDDGGYALATRVGPGEILMPDNWPTYLIRLEMNGTMRWAYRLASGGLDDVSCLRQTSDGGFITAGTDGSRTVLTKFTGTGTVQWSKEYPGYGASAVRQIAGGDFIVVASGDPNNSSAFQSAGILERISSTGTLRWARAFADVAMYGTHAVTTFSDVRETPTGAFVIVGTTSESGGTARTEALVVVTQPPPNASTPPTLSWAKAYGITGQYITGWAVEVGPDGKGYAALSGDPAGGVLLTFDVGTQATVMARTIAGFHAHSVCLNFLHGPVLGGGAAGGAAIVELDGTGSLFAGKKYSGDGEDVKQTTDGGYVLSGQGGTGPLLYLVKTDVDLSSGCQEQDFAPATAAWSPTVRTVTLTSESATGTTDVAQTSSVVTGEGMYCSEDGCLRIPENAVLWLTLDETTGTASSNSAGGNAGTRFGSPVVGAGFVDHSLTFNGTNSYVNVPSYTAVNVPAHAASPAGTGNFTVEAWVKRTSASDGGVRVILDKRVESPTVIGYSLYLFNGQLSFQLADGTFTNYNSLTTVPFDGAWHHVAAVVRRNSATGGQFYLDGQPVGTTFDTSLHNGSLGNSNPVRIGSRSSSVSAVFLGGIDEPAVYRRALSSDEIAAIWRAGANGKCRIYCRVPTFTTFCATDNQVTVSAQIFNSGVTAAGADDWLQALPIGTGSTIQGPITFSGPLVSWLVPAGGSVSFNVTITRPVQMTNNSTARYRMFVNSPANSDVESCDGAIQARYDVCTSTTGGGSGGITFVGRTTNLGPFTVQNTSGAAILAPYQFVVLHDDGTLDTTNVSLNGAPPGTAASGTLNLGAGESVQLALSASQVEYAPLHAYTLLLQADVDGSGMQPLSSLGLLNVVPGDAGTGSDGPPAPDPQPVLRRPGLLAEDGSAPGRPAPALRASPSITRSGADLRFAAPLAERGRVTIYDVAGRVMTTLEAAAGSGSVRWDGRDGEGRAARAGVYYAKLSAGALRADALICVVR